MAKTLSFLNLLLCTQRYDFAECVEFGVVQDLAIGLPYSGF